MRYIKVEWLHNSPEDPIVIYSEIDGLCWDQRKVELFPNGRIGYADSNEEFNGTILGIEPWDDLEKMALDPEFKIDYISRADFELVWTTRKQKA
jgi:hypothetical protein